MKVNSYTLQRIVDGSCMFDEVDLTLEELYQIVNALITAKDIDLMRKIDRLLPR